MPINDGSKLFDQFRKEDEQIAMLEAQLLAKQKSREGRGTLLKLKTAEQRLEQRKEQAQAAKSSEGQTKQPPVSKILPKENNQSAQQPTPSPTGALADLITAGGPQGPGTQPAAVAGGTRNIGGREIPNQIRTTQTTTGPRDVGPAGILPFTTRQTQTRPNVLTAAQAETLAQQDREFMTEQNKELVDKAIEVHQEFGVPMDSALRFSSAWLSGDAAGAADALGGAQSKSAQLLDLELRNADLMNEKMQVEIAGMRLDNKKTRAELDRSLNLVPLAVQAGLMSDVAVVNGYEPTKLHQRSTTIARSFDKDGELVNDPGPLWTVQNDYFNEGALYIPRKPGGFFGTDVPGGVIPIEDVVGPLVVLNPTLSGVFSAEEKKAARKRLIGTGIFDEDGDTIWSPDSADPIDVLSERAVQGARRLAELKAAQIAKTIASGGAKEEVTLPTADEANLKQAEDAARTAAKERSAGFNVGQLGRERLAEGLRPLGAAGSFAADVVRGLTTGNQ